MRGFVLFFFILVEGISGREEQSFGKFYIGKKGFILDLFLCYWLELGKRFYVFREYGFQLVYFNMFLDISKLEMLVNRVDNYYRYLQKKVEEQLIYYLILVRIRISFVIVLCQGEKIELGNKNYWENI